jgi:hypothetical protein
VSWLTRLLGRDDAQTKRIAEAQAEREGAAADLAEAQQIAARRRELLRRNHITEGFAAAFERRRATP